MEENVNVTLTKIMHGYTPQTTTERKRMSKSPSYTNLYYHNETSKYQQSHTDQHISRLKPKQERSLTMSTNASIVGN